MTGVQTCALPIWTEVECLAACVNAPVVQIGKDYYEDLTPESLEAILENLKAGRAIAPGPQNGRQASAPLGGPTTLTDPALYRQEEAAGGAEAPKSTPRKSQRPRPR